MNDLRDTVKKIIKGDPVPAGGELKKMIKALKGEFEFGLARKVLAMARDKSREDRVWIIQQSALCTYKDEELLPDKRFADALALLDEIGLIDSDDAVRSKGIDPSTLPETLALGGAVYKRKWEYDGQLEHLHQALAFYNAAWDKNPAGDKGYGGVNAAFILDILASRAKTIALRSGIKPDKAENITALQAKARKLREEMLDLVPKLADDDPSLLKQYWYLVTLAEIHFGLKSYEEAKTWLSKAQKTKTGEWIKIDEWELQTTFKQLVSLARIQGCELPREGSKVRDWHPSWQALHELLGEDTEPALSCYRGKVGLALSGGGFRASLFHLGVLARLAEMDALRSVEVLSAVSGGSIVGAHYYLEVQNLLQTKKDCAITREDYIKIVRRVQECFLGGIQRNLRTRALADLCSNIKMIFSKEYSRSHRLGELYEKELYSHVQDDNCGNEQRTMPQLLIKPADKAVSENFKPQFSNWRRRARVPVLLLNTTSLNSGHSWHFTARWMGEPPGTVGTEVDVNERYRRLWYDQAPEERHKNYRLGYAVAASACVPGLFEPLTLEGLYPGRTVRLVDGGVHDNQGVEALLNEGCTLVLCSDASGQMDDKKRPSDSITGVLLRSYGITMDRVRESEYQDLRSRVDSRAIQGLFFIHLKKDLETLPIDWIDCNDPTVPPQISSCTTPYGVDRDLQRKLAAMRTDLDSFTEVEAYSLMLSGYLITEYEFKELDKQHKKECEPGTWGGYDVDAPRGEWPFLKLEHLIRQPQDSSDARRQDLGKQLDVGSSSLFKIWKLSPALRWTSFILAAAALYLLVWLIHGGLESGLSLPPMKVAGLILPLAFTLAVIIWPALKWLRPREAVRGYLQKIVIALGGWILTNLHLLIFERMFLRRGSLKRLMKLP